MNVDMKFVFWKIQQIHRIGKSSSVYVYESVSFTITFNLLLVHGFLISLR